MTTSTSIASIKASIRLGWRAMESMTDREEGIYRVGFFLGMFPGLLMGASVTYLIIKHFPS